MELHIGEAFNVDPGYLVTERSAVIGQSGSGKSYLVSVICEELAANDLGFVVIDTEGEYAGLRKIENIEIIDDIDEIESLATNEQRIRGIITKSQKIVLDVSETEKKTINAFLDSIYREATKLYRDKEQNPFLIIVEEADIYIPQRGSDGLEILQVIGRRGRKRGLGILFATQRPALVNKNVLSQCNNVFIGKLTLKNDIDSVRIFFPSMDDARLLTVLEPGQFYVQGSISDPSFIKVRQRKTHHGGATPSIKEPRSGLTEDLTERVDVKEAQGLDKTEHARVRLALDAARGGTKVRYIPYDENKVINALNRNKHKQFKFFGKSESIIDLKLLMLPIYFVSVRELKKRLVGTKFVDYRILIDAITGDILSPDGIQRRSENLRYLADLNEIQLKVMGFILEDKGASYAKLRELLPGKHIKPSLKKLEEMHLIGLKDDIYFPLRDISYPKSLASQNADALKTSNGRADNVIKRRISKQKLNGLIRGLYSGCEVMGGEDVVYSPVLEAIYAGDGTERHVRIDALTGKTLHSE